MIRYSCLGIGLFLIAGSILDAEEPVKKPRAIERQEIEVFRHHPGIIDTPANMRAKEQDNKVIFKALSEIRMGYNYGGGLGRLGYTLEIDKSDLNAWKAMIDRLLGDGKLKYYRWGLDSRGFGLFDVSGPRS